MQKPSQTFSKEYVIREIETQDHPQLLSFLKQELLPREFLFAKYLEPLSLAAIEKSKVEDEMLHIFDAYLASGMLHGLVAIQLASQKIVGLNLFFITTKNQTVVDQTAKILEPTKSKILADWYKCVLTPIEEKIDFFEKFPGIKSTLKIDTLCVDENHGGRGLGTALLQEALNYARARGIGLVETLVTSPYSKKIFERAGLVVITEIESRSFKDSTGKPMYNESRNLFAFAMRLYTDRKTDF
ncbi:hypothetical protein QAD02_017764 [Eretmocerus hayati]|uniref:Uncharacterized protein n=1 Tax=Eretmocerus hayati TaxID=131215 RepID=A0ACC2PHS3_9HYME|nr:hypothetical protein QAD02_017764 [Eretmocerus hayati]